MRLLFTGVAGVLELLKVLERVRTLGRPLRHEFEFLGAGHGHVLLLTNRTERELEEALRETPVKMTGTEEVREDKNGFAKAN